MPSYHSSKHHSNSFVSSPTWSLNTLTSTTASSGSGGGLPVTPGLSPVSLLSPLGSARSVSMHSGHGHAYAYASQMPSTPGAPHMGTVPLPLQHPQHSLPTPPVSPERSRYTLSELLVYTGNRPPAKLNYNAVQPPSSTCLHPSSNPNALNEPAISTRAPHLLLDIPGISGGHFYASSTHGAGHSVTVREVLQALHVRLSERASQGDYNHLPSENHRRAASASYSQRNRAMPDPAGLRRFDLLGGRTTFAGLQRAANGADVWHVCFI
ncbi:hypothetical protein F5888DRAFT_1041804 [Russula emetica]|nr:hypothetical protein F5888DRAFT_1041804 [Russula emetica]